MKEYKRKEDNVSGATDINKYTMRAKDKDDDNIVPLWAQVLMIPLATIILSNANACKIAPPLHKGKSKIEAARCDAKITATLQNALQEDADLSLPTIHVKTNQKIVTLYGKVYTLEEKRVVISLARSIKGVKSVHSTLRMPLQG
jgi:hypothetical protein